ncbi:serine hydrolase domain-containing protein [Jiulongibacter sp. NS-SX5]|uniref:serine hydrolase domain-containing protein n=1 Tax=Jiulongibacter sp. NS-SX5 TaxID=3463854 RepID=UPI00405981F1
MKFKKVFQIVLISSSIVSLFFVPWGILRMWLTPMPDTLQEQVNQAIDDGFDGILVYVDKKGQEPQFYSAGCKDRISKTPADPNSYFKIASISKLYVAAAVAKLVANEQLSLDDKLADHLPDVAIKNADQITLRMMVQHRSGIPNFTDASDYPWGDPPQTMEATLKLIEGESATFEPDAKYQYSNTNFVLLGAIMDRTLGYSHHKYIRSEIIEPLGLKHTFSLMKEIDTDSLMSGYMHGFDHDAKTFNFVNPSGSMISTIEDTGIFLRALIEGDFFTEKEQEIYSSIYTYHHTGLLPGYQSIARYHEDMDAVIIQFTSTSGGVFWNKSEIIYDRIVRLVRKNQ